ncbi:MAG: hypothetical protein J6M26_02045 [Clostridia bacterium]|nr:hypothetical protein [Clostridia bacterium]
MKKKGLIVATIVMVLVLAVSLTTATYAWFTSDAQATIDNLSIKATAIEGVEIAVKTKNNSGVYTTGYTFGDLAYSTEENINWTSTEENDGFGSLLDFDAVDLGNITNAVTKATDTTLEVYSPEDVTVGVTPVDGMYTISTDGKPSEATGTALADTEYYTKGASVAGKYYRPIGYDENVEPTGYFAVDANIPAISYYDLPLAVKTTKKATAIMVSLSLKNLATGSFLPGMAAATRVEITINGNTHTWEPYKSCQYAASGMTGYNATEGTLNFVIAGGGDIQTTEHFDFQIKIWVEGTDPECRNATTVDTNFTVDFAFDWYEGEVTVGTAFEKDGTTYEWLTDESDNGVYVDKSL